MDSTSTSQRLHLYNHASEGNPFMASHALVCGNDISGTISRGSQHDNYPGSQSILSGRPGPPSELSSLKGYGQDDQWWMYAGYQSCLPSSYHPATIPSGHPVSRQRYNEGDIATSFRAVGGSLSGPGWRNPTGDGSPLSSMDECGQQTFQASFMKPYNSSAKERGYSEVQQDCTEQSVPERTNALHGIGSGFNVSDGYHGSESIRDNANQNWNPAAMETTPTRQSQWRPSQEIDDPMNPSMTPAFGIDPSLLDKSYPRAYGSFAEDVDKTNIGAFDSQNERYLHNLGDFDAQFPSGPSAFMAPTCEAESRDIVRPTASNTAPGLYHGAHSQFVPGSSENCKTCGEVFSGEWQKDNLRRHMREKHHTGQKIRYKCLLNKNGVACHIVVDKVRYRRKHVESVHQRESRELPPPDANRRPNKKTDKMLDNWFAKFA